MAQVMQFFGQDGRTGRLRFLVALLLSLAVLAGCFCALGELATAWYGLVWSVAGLALGRLWGEAARRLHDVGLSGWLIAFVAPSVVGITLSLVLLLLTGRAALIVAGIALAACGWLFLRPGRKTVNRYGAPPPRILAVGRGSALAAWTVGAAFLCGTAAVGAAFGLWVASISDNIATQNERLARAFGAAAPAPAAGQVRSRSIAWASAT